MLDPLGISVAMPPTNANGSADSSYESPTIAFDGSGYVVVWTARNILACDGASGRDLLGARLTTAGTPIDPPLSIETSLPDSSRSPAIASDGAGHALVVYEHASSLMSGRTTVRARLLTLAGSRRRHREHHDDDSTARCRSVTCTASDACHVAGTCDRSTGACSNPAAPDGTACGAGQVCRAAVCVSVAPPRLIAPLSTATVSSRRPTLRWALGVGADGARVEVCRDRACTTVVASFDAVGASGAPAADLPAGVLFWRTRGRAGASTGTSVSPTWEFTVGARSAPVNVSWGTTLDVNGDGFADVAVGAPGDSSGEHPGQVILYFGSPTGLVTTTGQAVDGPNGPSDLFGVKVASAGDINGDGFADLAVSARHVTVGGARAGGRVHVYFGSATGISATRRQDLDSPDGIVSYFGVSVAGVGDIDGDGYGDLAVGSSREPIDGPFIGGWLRVYFGTAAGLSPTRTQEFANPDGDSSAFAVSIASAGDLNGDGFADLAVGADRAFGSTREAGRVHVYLGSATGLTTAPGRDLERPDGTVAGRFGHAIAGGGDLNGDGYADLAVGGGSGAQVHVYLGSATGLATSPSQSLDSPDGISGSFGFSLASAGDGNGDGYADLAIASINAPTIGGSGVGRVHVHFGSAAGVATGPDRSFESPDGPFYVGFGYALSWVGDVHRDGSADLAIGAHSAGVAPASGRLHLYFGGRGVTWSSQTIDGPGGAFRGFGAALSWVDHHLSPMGLVAGVHG